MPNTRSQGNLLLELNSNPKRILQPNYMMIEPVCISHLEGVRDDPNMVPPSLLGDPIIGRFSCQLKKG